MNWDIYNLPLTLVCFSSTFSDDAADEHSDGSPEDGQDDAGVWEREHEDGHVWGHEWVHSTHLLYLFVFKWVSPLNSFIVFGFFDDHMGSYREPWLIKYFCYIF